MSAGVGQRKKKFRSDPGRAFGPDPSAVLFDNGFCDRHQPAHPNG